MSSTAPQGFRRTAGLRRSLHGSSSRDPGLTNCPPDRGNSLGPSLAFEVVFLHQAFEDIRALIWELVSHDVISLFDSR